MRVGATPAAACALSSIASRGGAAEPKLEVNTVSLDPPIALAEPLRRLLGSQAAVVQRGSEGVVARFWLRKEIPVRATPEQYENGLTYRELPATTVIGAVEFPRPSVEFRKQEIAAGTYTMHFALQPETADHRGTAPRPEFVLLPDAGKDRKPDGIEPKSLVERSSEVTGGGHPAVMLLYPYRGKDPAAKVEERSDGIAALARHSVAVAGDRRTSLGFAVSNRGHAKDRWGNGLPRVCLSPRRTPREPCWAPHPCRGR